LREVGATNATRASDYAAAIGEQTAAILRVQTSNYRVVGSSAATTLAELVALGRQRQLPVIDDLGSGGLIDFSRYGVTGEPIASDSVRAGADVVLLSGDKLLGGPQCGILVGRRAPLERIARHPLRWALRVDAPRLAALQATLQLYGDLPTAELSIPLLSLLATPLDNLKNRALRLAPQMQASGVVSAAVVEDVADLCGSAVPAQQIPTCCISLVPAEGNAESLANRLRTGKLAVVGRLQNDRLLLDLRSVLPRQDIDLVAAVQALAKAPAEPEPPMTPVP
jgi:L-seryl-tRNA(Ser) seleniumtransferase